MAQPEGLTQQLQEVTSSTPLARGAISPSRYKETRQGRKQAALGDGVIQQEYISV